MKRRTAIGLLAAPLVAQEKNLRVVVQIETELGEIVVALSGDRAPQTVENFLRYVDAGLYSDGAFHRSVRMDNQQQSAVKIEVIQGGIAAGKQGFAPVALERTRTTGLRHVNGAISMARSGVNSATSDFFLCIGDQPELDFGGKRNPDGQGFAVFGLTLRGLDVIRKIQQREVNGQSLQPPVRIVAIRRVEAP